MTILNIVKGAAIGTVAVVAAYGALRLTANRLEAKDKAALARVDAAFATKKAENVSDTPKGTTAHDAFLTVYNNDKIPVLVFDDTWSNGTGYFDNLVNYKTGLSVGSRFKSMSGDNRRIIGVVTPIGNVVFFERYTDGDSGVVVSNVPKSLRTFVLSGSAKVDDINMAAAYEHQNIGHQIAAIIAAAKTTELTVVDNIPAAE